MRCYLQRYKHEGSIQSFEPSVREEKCEEKFNDNVKVLT